MQIKIRQKFCLMTHKLGSSFLILNSSYYVKIFPGLLEFIDLDTKKSFKIFLFFEGPVKDFTIFQNLKNGDVKVSFHTKRGFLSYKIIKREKFLIFFEKVPSNKIEMKLDLIKTISSKNEITLPIKVISDQKPTEKISFGIHKKQDLDLIKKRADLTEILPFIFLYSQFYQDIQSACIRKKCIVKELTEKIISREKKDLEQSFLNVLNAHFFEAFIPRVNDEDYQNIIPIIDEKDTQPLHILRKLFYIIKLILIDQKPNEISILPCLLTSFHHGRALNITTNVGSFDIEWSKKLIKKLIFRPSKDIKIKLIFQSKIRTYRLKSNLKEKGKIFKNKEMISFEKDKIYFLDKFQK
ncbi:MAG: hypothetical protein K940chlam1_00257 [Candidatus Anoxychlamydiales bacterium]|nr:hypothetical protein [Candidatus Anoxychlamydiales bacterium]NGX35851.1 hypothetical protein [Candidatus Anoxychlamydiales bacterium]